MKRNKKALTFLLMGALLCYLICGCSAFTSFDKTGSEEAASKKGGKVTVTESYDIRDIKLSEEGLDESIQLGYNGGSVENMAELMGARDVLGDAKTKDAASDEKAVLELAANTEWSRIDDEDGKSIQTAVFFWEDGTGRYRIMDLTDGQKVISAEPFNWQAEEDTLLLLFKDTNESCTVNISGEEMTLPLEGAKGPLKRNGEDYIIQGGEYSFSELEGRWKMVYCVSSTDNEDLMSAGVNSFIDFLDDGKVRFQFFFEYVKMYIPEGKYHLNDGQLMEGFLNKAWYCSLEGNNAESEDGGRCYCDFTLYGDYMLVRCARENDSTTYVGLMKKAEE